MKKKEILLNTIPSLMTFIVRAGHKGTNLRYTNHGYLMDFDGEKKTLKEIRAFLNEHYTFRHMHTNEMFKP